MAKLFDPQLASLFVWQVADKADKSKPQKTLYVCDPKSEWEHTGVKHGHTLVSDHGWPLGRYDDEGFYCIHKPPVEGINAGLGKYVRHPLATDAKATYEKDLMYERHGRNS